MSPKAKPLERAPLILVVDDDETQRLLTRDCLEREGFRIREAEDGDAALDSMRVKIPDAVLLDVNMPGRDGFAICDEIRGDPTLSEIPIVLVTGREDDASIRRAFAAKTNDFITKPVLWPLLPHRLRFVLRAHRLQNELRTALTAAEAASTVKTHFLANVSHELRTPLNYILGFSEIIESEISEHLAIDKLREYAREIHSGGRQLLTTINDVLDIANLESGTTQVTDERTALQNIAAQAARMQGSHAAHKDITLINGIGDDAPEILGDERRLIQILVILLSNAIKFSASGDKVELSLDFVDERGLAIAVADTGPGIAAEDLPRIMEAFQQLDDRLSRQHEGTGLGIPIARALARLHGGDLVYESQLGEGTTARLLLPADRIVRPNGRPHVAHRRAAG